MLRRIPSVALKFSDWAERFIPDAFVFALLATVIVVVAGRLVAGATGGEIVAAWGGGFWSLLTFTMQMALVIVTGYVLATARPVYRAIEALATLPKTARGATTMVAVFAMVTSWLNWGFSLVFSAMLARATARRRPEADYRALAASTFLGLGSVWAQGLSGSAALQMATPGTTISPEVRAIVAHDGLVPSGLIPLRYTIFLWQSFVAVVVEIAIVALVVWLYTPPLDKARTAAQLGVDLSPPHEDRDRAESLRPAERFEHSPVLTIAVVGLATAYLVTLFTAAPRKLDAVNLNTINLAFLMLGALLHWTPARLMRAVKDATPAVWGVVLQFPFYGGIEGIISKTKLNEQIAHAFVAVSTPRTFPPLIAIYSAVLGVFVPSGGSKWVIEAPYVMKAAHELKVHLGWTVSCYDLGEAVANLVQPFWMLPTLALLGLRARDVMGFTFVVFVVLVPVVLALVTIFGATLPYPL